MILIFCWNKNVKVIVTTTKVNLEIILFYTVIPLKLERILVISNNSILMEQNNIYIDTENYFLDFVILRPRRAAFCLKLERILFLIHKTKIKTKFKNKTKQPYFLEKQMTMNLEVSWF